MLHPRLTLVETSESSQPIAKLVNNDHFNGCTILQALMTTNSGGTASLPPGQAGDGGPSVFLIEYCDGFTATMLGMGSWMVPRATGSTRDSPFTYNFQQSPATPKLQH